MVPQTSCFGFHSDITSPQAHLITSIASTRTHGKGGEERWNVPRAGAALCPQHPADDWTAERWFWHARLDKSAQDFTKTSYLII